MTTEPSLLLLRVPYRPSHSGTTSLTLTTQTPSRNAPPPNLKRKTMNCSRQSSNLHQVEQEVEIFADDSNLLPCLRDGKTSALTKIILHTHLQKLLLRF